MKTIKFGLALAAALCLLVWFSNAASAHTSVSVGIGVGYPGFYGGYYGGGPYRYSHPYRYYGPGWGPHHYYPYRETFIVGGDWYYTPDYYVVAPPAVIERPPVVVEKQVVVVQQPQGPDKDTQALFETMRYKKGELLKKLQTGSKEERKDAINELAGFSFDDKVREALENVLLSDPDPELRKEAAQTFGKVKNVKAIAALEKARVEDSSQDVRKEADNTIRGLKGN